MAANFADMKFDNTLGALMVGGLVATALYGVTCVQTYNFFIQKSKDPVWFKRMVAFLWILDTFDSVLNGHFLYFYMVTNYLKPMALLEAAWSVIAHVAVTGISNFIIRVLFAQRLWLLSEGNRWLTGLIIGTSTADLVVSLIITIKAFRLKSFVEFQSLTSIFYTSFGTGTGSDLLVALSLCFYLWRSRTGFQTTDSLIQSLMKYTINTGLLVAIDAGAGMVTYAVMPRNYIFLGFYLLLSKLYLNSYLAALNAREGLRKHLDEPVSIHLSQLSGNNSGQYHAPEFARPSISLQDKSRPTIDISVSTLVSRKVDEDSNDRMAIAV